MVILLLLGLLIQPWIIIPSANILDQMRLPQGCFMDIIFLGLIIFSFCRGNQYQYKNKYLSWLFGWLCINFIMYYFIPFSMEVRGAGRSLNVAMLEPMTHIFLGLWATQAVLTNFEKEDFVRIAKVLCVSSVLIASWAILQFIGFDPFGRIAQYHCGNRVSACLDNPNLVGMYLTLCLSLFFMFKNLKYWVGAVIVFIGILVTKSHFAIALSVFTTSLFFFMKFRRKYLTYIILLVLLFGMTFLVVHFDFAKMGDDMSGRTGTWKIALEKLKLNPAFGQGVGIWKMFRVDYRDTRWEMVHNDWLERAIEIGLIGVLLMIGVIVNSLRKFTYEGELNYSYLCMFVVFLVFMIGSFPLEVPSIAILGLISFWGMEKL